jgi:hypothetical protein
MSSSEINDNDDDDKRRKDLKTKKKASHFSRSFSDSVRHSSEQKRKQNSNLFLLNLLRFRGFGGEDTDRLGLGEEKSVRDVRKFVHRGNKVGTVVDHARERVVNTVGRVLEVGVRESLIEGGEKIRFERKELARRRKSSSSSSSSSSSIPSFNK